jgi:hypothetical protein
LSVTQNERKRELECLRLASDLAQLARDTPNPGLRVRCARMAEYWADQADQADGEVSDAEPVVTVV